MAEWEAAWETILEALCVLEGSDDDIVARMATWALSDKGDALFDHLVEEDVKDAREDTQAAEEDAAERRLDR